MATDDATHETPTAPGGAELRPSPQRLVITLKQWQVGEAPERDRYFLRLLDWDVGSVNCRWAALPPSFLSYLAIEIREWRDRRCSPLRLPCESD